MNFTEGRKPWTFAAVSVMVIAVTLLLNGLTQMPAIQLLPSYVAAYILIGAFIFGPVRRMPSPRQALAFLLPGVLLVMLALQNLGFWCGGWLLGLPAWGLLLTRWTPENSLPIGRVLKFLGQLVLGLVIFTFNGIFPVFSLGLFLLPAIPLIQLAKRKYRPSPLQAAVEVLLAMAAVVVAFMTATPEGSWSSPWVFAGGAATAGMIVAFWAQGLPMRSPRTPVSDGATA